MSDSIRTINLDEFKEKITSCGFQQGISGTYIGYNKSGCININERSILITIYGHNEIFDKSLHEIISYLYPTQYEKVLKLLGKVYIDESIEEDGLTAYAAGIKNNTFLRVVLE